MTRSLSQQDIASLDASQLTPAMRQYQSYKAQYPDAILFFRIGDFYETFYEDARTISRVLGVALTSRSKGENAVPMAGVPYHAVDSYLQRMIAAGYRVAICEQMEDPKQVKGLIDRQVTRLITPGTLTEDTMLEGKEENFITALVLLEKAPSRTRQNTQTPANQIDSETDSQAALAWCELSTGKFLTLVDSLTACREELSRIRPREMLIAEAPDHQPPEWARQLKEAFKLTLTARPAWQLDAHHGAKTLREHYGVLGFAGFGYAGDDDPALRAAGAIVAYLHETQKASLEHLCPPKPFERRRHLVIDQASLRSLEVLRTLRNNTPEGSLVWALDRTKTPMGSRLLRNWLLFPLRDPAAIERRLQVISDLMQLEQALEEIRLIIADCSDVERIGARICCRRATPRDLAALARSLDTLPAIVQRLKQAALRQAVLDDLEGMIPAAGEISAAIRATLQDEPPAHLREGGVIRDGFNAELDRLRSMANNSRTWLADYQAKLIKTTGISSLKVGYNKVFGFYIEVTHTHANKMPPEFVRRQTVKNAERYITPELKEFESDMLSAQQRSVALEQDLFEQLRSGLAEKIKVLQSVAAQLAALDVYASIAHLARTRRYCRPKIALTQELNITEARHPVVEQILGDQFVPNDVVFAAGGPTLQLLTGPNMAGKSTYIRQVALLVLMAQAGFYLPAAQATVGLVDRIFTRVGAADDLAAGQSTFMVEMTETANILLHATSDSLVILDEVGRGTSTLDGLALAWAIAEYLAGVTGCRTLFATHYHELTELSESTPAVSNFNVLVREWEDQILFMHRIAPGSADKSYGVHVARLAGVPRSVIQRARRLMDQLTVHVGRIRPRAAATAATAQVNLFDPVPAQVISQLQALDLNRMSPMQAWEALRTMQALLAEKREKQATEDKKHGAD
ncbi:MAG TPA: DNA mismatch repair protein MutS [Phycisphaerae bacterium]|nr:DNA mismatch repair protein MutS [Phycisphaerae bacterium]